LKKLIEKNDDNNIIILKENHDKIDEKKKEVKTLKKHTQNIKIEQMSEEKLKNWIKSQLHENYKDIKQDALELILELTGVNFNVIKQEIEKLILFLGERTTINKQDVHQIVNRSLEQNVFL